MGVRASGVGGSGGGRRKQRWRQGRREGDAMEVWVGKVEEKEEAGGREEEDAWGWCGGREEDKEEDRWEGSRRRKRRLRGM